MVNNPSKFIVWMWKVGDFELDVRLMVAASLDGEGRHSG